MKLIALSGLARAGKDSFFSLAQDYLKTRGITASRHAFAEEVKRDMQNFLQTIGLNVWTEENEEKELVRPYLIAHGQVMRQKTNGRHWIDKLEPKLLESTADVKFITDLRFATHDKDEGQWVKSLGGSIIHIRRYTNSFFYERDYDPAPNAEEEKNDPKVRKIATRHFEWQKWGVIGEEARKEVYNFMEINEHLWR